MIENLERLGAAATLDLAARVRAARDQAEVDLLQVAAHFADLNTEPHHLAEAGVVAGMEKTRVYGGRGCPEIGDFAPVDLGAALGISSHAASALIGDVLGLRHRLPKTWARVLAGEVQAWRARKIAAASVTLSPRAAALVDARVAPIAQKIGAHRLGLLVQAAVMEADPQAAQAAADAAERERGVWVGQSDLHGTKTMVIKAASGDVIVFEAAVDHLADVLAELGDTDGKDQRRAKAVGLLANPQVAADLWHVLSDTDTDTDIDTEPEPEPAAEPGMGNGPAADTGTEPGMGNGPDADAAAAARADTTNPTHTSPTDDTDTAAAESAATSDIRPVAGAGTASATGGGSGTGTSTGGGPAAAVAVAAVAGRAGRKKRRRRRRDRNTLYVHISEEALHAGGGVIRVEGLGPLLASQLRELLGHDQFVVKPVIDLRDQVSVDAYEIPDRIRERVRLRYLTCVFPYCNAPATISMDLDHVVPFDDTGPPGQTSTMNLGPQCKWHHRVKTHGLWTCRRLVDGAYEWTSPHGAMFRVTHTGTQRIDSGDSTDHSDRTDASNGVTDSTAATAQTTARAAAARTAATAPPLD